MTNEELKIRFQELGELEKFLNQKVKFALIYGSMVTNYFTDESDIDVAVFLGYKPDRNKFFELKEVISEAFNNRREIDLLILDTADPIITMQIIANGILVVNNDPLAFIKFKALAISKYIDFKIDRKMMEDSLINNILSK